MKNRPHSPASISELAAEWLIELADAGNSGLDEERRREFMSWLKRSPQHIEEFLAIAVLEQELAELLAGEGTPLAEIVAELKNAAAVAPEPLFATPAAPVAASAPSPRAIREPVRRQPRARRALGWLAAAGVAAMAVVLAQFLTAESPAVRHVTGLGEQRSVALKDGSIVMLNTLSEVDIRIGRSQRHAALLAGEAMFDVARDARRPFVVEAGSVTLTVLGTKFSVYRMGEMTRVAVVEGAVQVVPDDTLAARSSPLVVKAGEGLVAGRDGVTPIGAGVEFDMAVVWTERRLVFKGAPLADVVHEFNRYNAVPIIIEDGELASREVTTVFKANDVGALVSFLELEPDVYVRRDDDAIRIRQRTDGPEDKRQPTKRE